MQTGGAARRSIQPTRGSVISIIMRRHQDGFTTKSRTDSQFGESWIKFETRDARRGNSKRETRNSRI